MCEKEARGKNRGKKYVSCYPPLPTRHPLKRHAPHNNPVTSTALPQPPQHCMPKCKQCINTNTIGRERLRLKPRILLLPPFLLSSCITLTLTRSRSPCAAVLSGNTTASTHPAASSNVGTRRRGYKCGSIGSTPDIQNNAQKLSFCCQKTISNSLQPHPPPPLSNPRWR